jgi:tRNA(adenine34) deaminase
MNQDQDTSMKCQENLKNIKYMKAALKEAQKAYDKGEIPVGAVIVYENQIIARAHNLRESKQIVHGHAEFLALMKAAKKLGTWRLEDCDVYVTMEPCPMCAGAMIQARIRSLHYATLDYKAGVVDSMINLFDLPFNHKVQVNSGVLAQESQTLIKDFFKKLRDKS